MDRLGRSCGTAFSSPAKVGHALRLVPLVAGGSPLSRGGWLLDRLVLPGPPGGLARMAATRLHQHLLALDVDECTVARLLTACEGRDALAALSAHFQTLHASALRDALGLHLHGDFRRAAITWMEAATTAAAP